MDVIVNIDGELQLVACSIIVKTIAKQLKMSPKQIKDPYTSLDTPFVKPQKKPSVKPLENPSVKPSEKPTKNSKSENTEEDEIIKEVLPILKMYTGLIIGNAGTAIKKLQEDTYTMMQVEDWNDEQAVLIRGQMQHKSNLMIKNLTKGSYED